MSAVVIDCFKFIQIEETQSMIFVVGFSCFKYPSQPLIELFAIDQFCQFIMRRL